MEFTEIIRFGPFMLPEAGEKRGDRAACLQNYGISRGTLELVGS